MPEIKFITISTTYQNLSYDDEYYDEIVKYCANDFSGWLEVSDEDLELIKGAFDDLKVALNPRAVYTSHNNYHRKLRKVLPQLLEKVGRDALFLVVRKIPDPVELVTFEDIKELCNQVANVKKVYDEEVELCKKKLEARAKKKLINQAKRDKDKLAREKEEFTRKIQEIEAKLNLADS